MSENSSDSESSSSCGWTIINHEGSDIETLNSENGETCSDLTLIENIGFVQDLQPDAPELQPDTCSNEDALSFAENAQLPSEEIQPAPVAMSCYNLTSEQENTVTNEPCCQEPEEQLSEDGVHDTVSDDSDIVTLEPPKVDEVGTLEEEVILQEEIEDNGEINMSSSTSSQYTFSQPETISLSKRLVTESSNDEASEDSSPALRRRRSKKSSVSVSESESGAPAEQPDPPESKAVVGLGNNLNKYVIVALLVALSLGFGHFYGTIQILERQKQVEKIHENELNVIKDDLFQCQKDQENTVEQKEVIGQLTEDLAERQDTKFSLKGLTDKIAKEYQLLRQKHSELKSEADDLATSLKTTEGEKKSLALENQHLRESLEKEEQALSLLQEELRKLREQIRNLEEKGRSNIVLSENQKLKAHLKEERQKVRQFLSQKESLLTEAQNLRKELDNERQHTESLKEELEEISNRQSSDPTQGTQEIAHLRERLSELEKKLNFEQQRSDLWERLYIEAKEQNEKLETGSIHHPQENEHSKDDKRNGKTKKKAKSTFFNSVKDTFDAMKNSTKDFVRHHKEKIKQAKEAVKENLKKFSDSVKTTFRQFKDSTKNMFGKDRYKKYAEKKQEETKRANTVRREYKTDPHEHKSKKATESQHEYKDEEHTKNVENEKSRKQSNGKKSSEQRTNKKGCSSVFECAHQESISLFNKVLDPVRVEEFNDLIHTYLLEQVDNFRHWKELEQFINRFFMNGVFIHDQMLFTDFVNDVEDYLEDLEEYQTNNGAAFEDLDDFVYRHFFGNTYSTPYGPSKPEAGPPYKDHEAYSHRKHEEKPHSKRGGKWHKHGRPNGRHMANVEIELGQLPFDPKY